MAESGSCPPPEERPVGLVFQEGALFPHLSVADNIAFGLPDRGLAKDSVALLLKQIGLEGYSHRYPDELSGGQRQRVALARALAPNPRVILMDEPFTAVDIVRRRALREETRKLLTARDAITVIVTHDPQEALHIADHIVVMDEGEVLQAASPKTIVENPASITVAMMFGHGQRIKAYKQDNGLKNPFGLWSLSAFHEAPVDETCSLVVRPDALKAMKGGTSGVIVDIRYAETGLSHLVESPSGEQLWVANTALEPFELGDPVTLQPKPGAVFIFA